MAENTAINNVPICDYVAEFKMFLGKYHEAIQTVKKQKQSTKNKLTLCLENMAIKWRFILAITFSNLLKK